MLNPSSYRPMTGSAEMNVEEPTAKARRLAAVTEEVLRSFDGTESPRLKAVLSSLVRHLHAFALDVGLTEQEWTKAIDYLTKTGQMCTDTRQEFILLSDVLGLSMLTVGLNAPADERATESTVFGPFFVEGSPNIPLDGSISKDLTGTPCYVRGTVADVDGEPIPGARIEVWEADDTGFYDVQIEGAELDGRGHLFADDDGAYRFWSVVPAPYPIPYDGPVGELLTATARSPMRPAHLHFMVTAPGYHPLITHIFVAGGPHLDSDAVFGVKRSLIYEFTERPAGMALAGVPIETPWAEVTFDIRLVRD